jgi:hypothetical protein
MPVKNEIDVLPITLNTISQYCDQIIIADQMSTDGSRELYKKFPKVTVIDNPREGHSNQVRWDLLKKAREYGDSNLILCLDADEYIPVDIFKNFLNETEFNIGDSFRFPWIQLWKSEEYFNNTGVWYKNYQRAAWIDDGKTNYDSQIIINDHTSRVPQDFLKNCKRLTIPLIHLQWIFWEKTQYKQALYRCTELVKKPKDFIHINSSYSHSLDSSPSKLSPTPKEWIIDYGPGVQIPKKDSWHKLEIYKLFDIHGIEFFEPLEIWHIEDLKNEFVKRVQREPVSRRGKILYKIIKDIKYKIKKMIHY